MSLAVSGRHPNIGLGVDRDTIPQAMVSSADGSSVGLLSRENSHDLANELAYYKKAALFFACGFRTMNEVASEVPAYFWLDDHPERCHYQAQVRESSWPSNCPDVGQCEPKELLVRMASNERQIPRKHYAIDNS